MKKGLMLLADGFEQVEALGTIDVLNRTRNIETDYVSISNDLKVVSSSHVTVLAKLLLKDVHNLDQYDFIVLPGGKLGVDHLDDSALVKETILYFYQNNKYVCAICAAPSILGKMGLLDDKEYTCFPGFQKGNGKYIDTGSIIDHKIVTGHSMGYTIPFAENIVRVLLGEDYVQQIQAGIKGLQ